MCGIFSLLNNKHTFDKETINQAFEKGSSRGPEFSTLVSCDDNTILGFHRLAINGLNQESNQPICTNTIKLVCNGEIYNYKELYEHIDTRPDTDSDCEVIIHLYKKYGMEHTLRLIDGVYAFILYDYRENDTDPIIYAARDPYGVRPLYMMEASSNSSLHNNIPDSDINPTHEKIIGFASELKVLSELLNHQNKLLSLSVSNVYTHQTNMVSSYTDSTIPFSIKQFQPGTFLTFECKFRANSYWKQTAYPTKFFIPSYSNSLTIENNDTHEKYFSKVCDLLNKAVKKRVVGTSDRPIACLLSGGLDSSLITALVNKYYNNTLETYSIGMAGSEDLRRAKIVSKHLGTKHTEIILSKEEFFNSIPETIKAIESYDTTTVRASVGNYLIGKYIANNSKAKVIFNGDGSDELTGGYLYFLKSPDDIEFDKECRRRLCDIYTFDVLRSDKSISSNGLEPRTPFLDREFTNFYLSLPVVIRNPMSNLSYITNDKVCEKYLLRKAFDVIEPELLPKEILWRTKEAFSDGVSGDDGSWFEIIDQQLGNINYEKPVHSNQYKFSLQKINTPITREQQYYRELYDNFYPNTADIIPYFWMPKYVNASDSSARTLDVYNEANNKCCKSNKVDTEKKTNCDNPNILLQE